MVALAKRVNAIENPGDELLAAFRKAWVRHVAIQEQVSGAVAEAGRVLSQFRMVADGRVPKGKILPGLLNEAGGSDAVKRTAE